MSIKLVTLSMRQYGQLNQNRLYFSVPDGGLDEAQLAAHIRDNWITHYKVMMVNDVQFFNVNVRSVGQGQNLSFDLPVAVNGQQTPEPQRAPFASWVILLNTGLAGRKFRGRIYAPGMRQGDFQLGVITAGGVQLAELALTQLNLNFTSVATNPAATLVIHGEGGEPHDTAVSHMSVRSTMGVQRRRNIGVGQ